MNKYEKRVRQSILEAFQCRLDFSIGATKICIDIGLIFQSAYFITEQHRPYDERRFWDPSWILFLREYRFYK